MKAWEELTESEKISVKEKLRNGMMEAIYRKSQHQIKGPVYILSPAQIEQYKKAGFVFPEDSGVMLSKYPVYKSE